MPEWMILGAKTAATDSSDNPLQSFNDFFQSATWDFIVMMVYFLVVVVWLASAFWVYKDARRRIDDKVIIAVAVLTGLVFGPIGAMVYAIVRPPEYLADVRERELETRMMQERLAEGDSRCQFCKTPVKEDFLVCPTCGRRLRTSCPSCRKPIDPHWRVCPYCEAEMQAAAAAPAFDSALR